MVFSGNGVAHINKVTLQNPVYTEMNNHLWLYHFSMVRY